MKSRKRLLSLLFCMALTLVMCLAFSGSVFAADPAPQIISSGSTVTPTAINKIADTDSVKVYATPQTASTYSEEFTYNINAKKGTLFIHYAPTAGASCYISNVAGATYAGSGSEDDVEYRYYYVPSSSTVKVTFTVYGAKGGSGVFSMYYAAASKSIKSGKTYIVGSPGSTSASSVKIKAPAAGYLKVTVRDAIYDAYSVNVKTKGFKDWSYLSSSNNYTEYIGVKKGTYTIQLKGAELYKVKVSYVKIKETSAKTAKSKAASLTKNKINKGIVAVNKRKVHWYKIRNPKNQKLTLAVNAKKMSGGGSSLGKLKITCYFPDGKSSYGNLYAGTADQFKITYGKIGTTKALKGTYYIKVESQDGSNGYYTLKWK